MSNIELSVIVPVYNGGRFLRDLVSNFLDKNGSVRDVMELVFVDDGSVDDSYNTLLELSRIYRNIKVLHKDNGGIASARDMGLKHAQGTYVTFMDQDDKLEGSYDCCLDKIKSFGADMLISDYWVASKDGCISSRNTGVEGEMLCEASGARDLALNLLCPTLCKNNALSNVRIHPSIWNCLFLREALNRGNCHFFRFVDYEDDWLFVIQAILASDKVVLCDEKYYCWKENVKSESHTAKYIPNLFCKKQALEDWILKTLCQLSTNKKDREEVALRFEAHGFVECFYNSSLALSYADYKRDMIILSKQVNPRVREIKLRKVDSAFRCLLLHKCYFVCYLLNHYIFKRQYH